MKRSRIARKAPKVKSATLNHPERQDAPQDAMEAKKPALRKTKLKQVSQKRAGWLTQYAAEKKRRGPGPHQCIVCGATIQIGQNASWHHPAGRRTLEDLLHFVPVCERPCHQDRIHGNPNEAMKQGWLTPRYRR